MAEGAGVVPLDAELDELDEASGFMALAAVPLAEAAGAVVGVAAVAGAGVGVVWAEAGAGAALAPLTVPFSWAGVDDMVAAVWPDGAYKWYTEVHTNPSTEYNGDQVIPGADITECVVDRFQVVGPGAVGRRWTKARQCATLSVGA